MSPYRRAKREDALQPSRKEISISIGSIKDSIESLQSMCNDKSNEIIKSIELEIEEEIKVVYWTADFLELIGISTITKNNSGLLSYSLDFSQCTL